MKEQSKHTPPTTQATTSHATDERVACDGIDPAASHSAQNPAPGHPRIFLSFRGAEEVVCPYCSRRFVRGT